MNPNPTYYKRADIGNNRTAFMFDSLDNYNRFITETSAVATGIPRTLLDRYSSDNYKRENLRNTSWFGTTDINKLNQDIDTYLFNNQLDTFLNTLRSQTVNVDVIDIDQQKAIKFTDQEIGIFSFDLASLGLIRVYEYFSPLLKRVVNPNYVLGKKLPNGDTIFYHKFMPFVPQHEVNYVIDKGGFYSEILDIVIPKNQLIEIETDNKTYWACPERQEIPEHEVIRQQKIDEKGNLVFSSTFRKSFIYIPKIEKSLPRVDIILGSTFAAYVNAETQMIYSSMAAIAIAEKLSKSGVNYRFLATYPLRMNGGRTVYPFVVLKKEGEALDKNKMAVLTSDARQFRLNQFKAYATAAFDAGYGEYLDQWGIGYPVDNVSEIKTAYMDYLKSQNNPEDQAAAKNERSKIVLNGALSLDQATRQYNDVISQISKI